MADSVVDLSEKYVPLQPPLIKRLNEYRLTHTTILHRLTDDSSPYLSALGMGFIRREAKCRNKILSVSSTSQHHRGLLQRRAIYR